MTEINRFSQLLADTLERTVPLLEQLEDVSGQVDGGIEFLQRTLEQLVPVIALGGDGLGDLQLAADDLDATNQSAKAALEQIETALALAGNALTVEDESALRQGLAQAAQGIDELGTALEAMGRALGQIGDGLAPTEDWKELLERLDALQPAWDELAAALQAAADGLHSVARGVCAVLDNVNLDTRSLSDALDHVVSAVLQMSRAADRTEAAAGHLRDTLADGCLAAGRLEEAVQTLADAGRGALRTRPRPRWWLVGTVPPVPGLVSGTCDPVCAVERRDACIRKRPVRGHGGPIGRNGWTQRRGACRGGNADGGPSGRQRAIPGGDGALFGSAARQWSYLVGGPLCRHLGGRLERRSQRKGGRLRQLWRGGRGPQRGRDRRRYGGGVRFRSGRSDADGGADFLAHEKIRRWCSTASTGARWR